MFIRPRDPTNRDEFSLSHLKLVFLVKKENGFTRRYRYWRFWRWRTWWTLPDARNGHFTVVLRDARTVTNEYSFSFLKFIICVELVRQNYQTHVLLCINILNKHKPSKKDTSGIISGSKMTPKNILRIIAWLNTYFNKNFNSFQPLPVDLVSFPVQKLVQKSSSRMI